MTATAMTLTPSAEVHAALARSPRREAELTALCERAIAAPHEFTQAALIRLDLSCHRHQAALRPLVRRHTALVRAAEAAGKAIPADVRSERHRDAHCTADLDCF